MQGARLSGAVIAILLDLNGATEAEDKRFITRPKINGKPMAIPVAKTFDKCRANGMKLGRLRIDPKGETDLRGRRSVCAGGKFSSRNVEANAVRLIEQ